MLDLTISILRRLSTVSLLLIVLASGVYFMGRREATRLPDAAEIDPRAFEEPLQRPTERGPFLFEYMGVEYHVEPLAEYQLAGLVVTHNDISAFHDIYHDERSVDVRDLCLIWGENLKDDSFKELVYWSEPWSCHVRAPSREAFRRFDETALSNNHLLPANEEIKRGLQAVEVGDEVWISGALVNYSPAHSPERLRKSSTVRSDRGNGACEVIFVEQFTVLRRANAPWRTARDIAWTVLIASLAAKLSCFFLTPYLELRRRVRNNARAA